MKIDDLFEWFEEGIKKGGKRLTCYSRTELINKLTEVSDELLRLEDERQKAKADDQ